MDWQVNVYHTLRKGNVIAGFVTKRLSYDDNMLKIWKTSLVGLKINKKS